MKLSDLEPFVGVPVTFFVDVAEEGSRVCSGRLEISYGLVTIKNGIVREYFDPERIFLLQVRDPLAEEPAPESPTLPCCLGTLELCKVTVFRGFKVVCPRCLRPWRLVLDRLPGR